MFWGISLLVLLAAGVLVLWPLLGRESGWKIPALTGILLLPLAGYWLYHGVGSPQALDQIPAQAPHQVTGDASQANEMSTLTERLRQRLESNPEDVQGWVLLGRSYKTLQDYPLALEALENANRLAPDQPLVQVELVEARLFVSGNPSITPEMTATLEQAVTTEPTLQKGLWLLGIAAAQQGDDVRALEWWEKLIAQIEPGSQIEQSVLEQMDQARVRLGQTSQPAVTPPVATAPATAAVATAQQIPQSAPQQAPGPQGIDIRVELGPNMAQQSIPPNAVLFIIVRPEGAGGGPPLGARRVNQPEFPVTVTLTDKDSMMAQRPISSSPRLQLQARLSISGQPTPSAGDWQSSPSTTSTINGGVTSLVLDQQVK
jgi:cytochrome c-type biogenesis protein CcmH